MREIQINATQLGVVVWPKLGFGARNFPLVARDYRDWAEGRAGVPAALPQDPTKYPEEFLRTLMGQGKGLHLFKVLQ